eukprot:1160936-Pelagomonas_calceolata.AAC.20
MARRRTVKPPTGPPPGPRSSMGIHKSMLMKFVSTGAVPGAWDAQPGKLGCPDKKFCLACMLSLRADGGLAGSGLKPTTNSSQTSLQHQPPGTAGLLKRFAWEVSQKSRAGGALGGPGQPGSKYEEKEPHAAYNWHSQVNPCACALCLTSCGHDQHSVLHVGGIQAVMFYQEGRMGATRGALQLPVGNRCHPSIGQKDVPLQASLSGGEGTFEEGASAPPSHVDIATHRAASCAILCMQELADSKLPPLGVPDYVIVNNAKDPLLVVHKCLTEVAASMWHPPRASLPCTLVLEDLACWQVSRAGMVVVVVDTNCTSNAHHM